MKIAIGSDHRGDPAIAGLLEHMRETGHDVTAVGEADGRQRDYPDEAYLVGDAVRSGSVDRGVLICGSGIGMAIAANKVPGVRAVAAEDTEQATMSRRHNDANVLCLSADRHDPGALLPILDAWLDTSFEGGRHERRVGKIAAIERGEDPRQEKRRNVETSERRNAACPDG